MKFAFELHAEKDSGAQVPYLPPRVVDISVNFLWTPSLLDGNYNPPKLSFYSLSLLYF